MGLLGIQTASKYDLNISSAVLYGSSLMVPGYFLISRPSVAQTDHTFLPVLHAKVQGLTAVPTS